MITENDLLGRIDAFLKETGMAVSRFGREAANEPAFVSRLRGGMSPTLARANRVIAFMDGYRARQAADHVATDTTASPPASGRNGAAFTPQEHAA